MPLSICIKEEVLDFRYTRTAHDFIAYNFHIGDIFIGQIFSGRAETWAAVPFHTPCKYGLVEGFKTRYAASVFMLQVCGFIDKK